MSQSEICINWGMTPWNQVREILGMPSRAPTASTTESKLSAAGTYSSFLLLIGHVGTKGICFDEKEGISAWSWILYVLALLSGIILFRVFCFSCGQVLVLHGYHSSLRNQARYLGIQTFSSVLS